jgi:hypothetical protein
VNPVSAALILLSCNISLRFIRSRYRFLWIGDKKFELRCQGKDFDSNLTAKIAALLQPAPAKKQAVPVASKVKKAQ